MSRNIAKKDLRVFSAEEPLAVDYRVRKVLFVESEESHCFLTIIPPDSEQARFLVVLLSNPQGGYLLDLGQVVRYLISCGVCLRSCRLAEVSPEELEKIAGYRCRNQCDVASLFSIMGKLRDM